MTTRCFSDQMLSVTKKKSMKKGKENKIIVFTSLKSPILGMWFFLVFPKTEPLLEIITEEYDIWL